MKYMYGKELEIEIVKEENMPKDLWSINLSRKK